MKLKLALLCTLGLASVNAMASCYTVYDRSNQVVYNAQTPPVDMSRPLHETLPVAFPGGHLVFGNGTDCPVNGPSRVSLTPVSPSKPSPLLTDRRTAAALNLTHTVLPSGYALVNNPPASALGVTVLASSPAPLIAPAVQAQRMRTATVITEMHNPPLRIVQQGGMVVSELR